MFTQWGCHTFTGWNSAHIWTHKKHFYINSQSKNSKPIYSNTKYHTDENVNLRLSLHHNSCLMTRAIIDRLEATVFRLKCHQSARTAAPDTRQPSPHTADRPPPRQTAPPPPTIAHITLCPVQRTGKNNTPTIQ